MSRDDRQLLLQLAAAENLDRVVRAADHAGCEQGLLVHGGAVVEGIERVEIHDRKARLELRVVEAALGHAADERHLAAFEAEADAAAGTGLLAFVAFARGLAVAAAFAAAEALHPVLGAGPGFEGVQIHNWLAS